MERTASGSASVGRTSKRVTSMPLSAEKKLTSPGSSERCWASYSQYARSLRAANTFSTGALTEAEVSM